MKVTPAKKAESSSDSSSSDSEPELSKKPPTPASKPAAAASKKAESSSESSSSEEEEEEKPKLSPVKSQPSSGTKRKAESSSSSSESDSEDEKPAAKKAKLVTSTPAPGKHKNKTPQQDSGESKPASDSGIEEDNKFAKKKKGSTPFRRVVAETIEVNPNLTDNSANTSFDTWGAKVRTTNIVGVSCEV